MSGSIVDVDRHGYFRRGEAWWQTCRRTIEGMLTAQRIRCRALAALAVLATVGCATTPAGRIRAAQEQFDTFPEEIQANIRAGKVEVGYTKDMVQMALGTPQRRHHRTTGAYTEEVWSYIKTGPRFSIGLGGARGGGRTAVGTGIGVATGGRGEEQRRVIFRNGKVEAVEELLRD